jgi:hypothetical protein
MAQATAPILDSTRCLTHSATPNFDILRPMNDSAKLVHLSLRS